MKPFSLLIINNILVVVLNNELGDKDVKDMQQTVLSEITRIKSCGLILDISQVEVVDSYLVRILTDLSRMSRLLGSNTFIVGLRPSIVITMVEMGLDFREISSAANVDLALGQLSIKLPPKEKL